MTPQEFKHHLEQVVFDLLIDVNDYRPEKHDIKITLDGKSIDLGMNSESYELLKEMLDNEME